MYRCIGCDKGISWDGTGLFSYTCPCRATIFWNEETGQISMPASVVIGISKGKTLPHLDDLVGNSDFTSPQKTGVIEELSAQGFIWMRECEQCKNDGTLAHYEARLRREKRQEEIREQAKQEGWDMERTIQELVKVDKGG